MRLRRAVPFLLMSAAIASATPEAQAWSPALEHSLYRDAQRLLPRSLARLMSDRETAVFDAAQRPPQGLAALRAEIATGALKDTTAQAFDGELRGAAQMMANHQ